MNATEKGVGFLQYSGMPKCMIALCATAFLGVMATAQAEPISGVMRDGSEWTGHTWTTRDLWDYQTYAKDGGEATLLAGNHGPYKLDMNVSGLTLSGLMITQLTSPLYSANGYSINMCGASPYIGRNATTEFQLELPLVGDGTNILRKTGPGLIRFDTPVQNFGSFVVWEGTVCPSTNAAPAAIVSDGVPLVVRGGKVNFDKNATVGELRFAPDTGSVSVQDGATATVGALSREQGGVAVLYSTSGVDKLGDTEKILVSGRDSDAAGELDGSLATLDATAAPHPLDFVAYDGKDGFKRAGAGTALASGVDVTGIADVSAEMTYSLKFYEHIDSDSSRLAYIDTGYVPNENTEIEVQFSFSETLSTKAYVFGTYGSNSKGRFQFSYGPTDTGCFLGYGNNYSNSVQGVSYDTNIHTVKYVPGRGFYFDGNLVDASPLDLTTWAGTSANLFLGAVNPNGGSVNTANNAPIRIYSCKISENDSLKRDLRPATANGVVVGLYDVVGGKFYRNANPSSGNNGSFSAGGNEVESQITEGTSTDSLSELGISLKTISSDTSVTALRIKNGAQLAIGAGATLAVGDGTHPAGVLFQSSATDTATGAVNGDGTLAFGGKEGVFWFSPVKTDSLRNYAFATKVSGSAGVTFAGRRINSTDKTPYVTFASGYAPSWTGPTHIAGLRVVAGTSEFPGEIWVDGNDSANSGQLRFDAPRTWTQRLHLSGIGLSANSGDETLYFNFTGNEFYPVVFSGGVELLSSSSINANNKGIAQFKSPITGPGGLKLSAGNVGGYMSFDATNTYAGATKFSSSDNGSLIVNPGGTLGAGPVEIVSGNLLFVDQTDAVITNAITGAGILRFRDSTASVSGNVDIGTLRLGNWTNTTAIAVRNLAAGEITSERTCKITAVDANSVLTVGTNGANSAISCKVEDGAGVLSLVKRGANVVDVLGRKSYTGSTTIKAGTLRLQNSITNAADIAWWVDASDESTVTTNAEGRATNVASKNGNGVSFVQYSTFGLPYYDATVNGLKALRYTCTDIVTKEDGTRADGSWLRGDKRVQQRTVIMVIKPRLTGLSGNTGVFGAFGRDMGMRVTKNGWNSGWADASGSSYCTSGGFRQNGTKNNMTYYDDEASVVVMRQGTERLVGNYSANPEFHPALGGYATWGNKDQGFLGFNGDICEAIAFNRYLPDDEIKLIENYLSEKWRGSTINADAPTMESLVEQSDLLPTTTDLEIYPDATFDLNGVNQTVKTLSGQGRIINSSATPATLTVTGGITFRGVVGAGVTLLKGDGSAADLELRVEEGATLGVTNGTASVSPYVELPVTNHIAFWCDASYRPGEMIQRDDDGGVTNWISRMGFVSNFTFNTANEYCVTKPTYSTSSHGGRGAVKFSSGKSALVPSATCELRTVFLLTKLGESGQYIFGRDHYDLSFRAATGWFNLHGKFNINPVGALAHINGVDYTDAAISALYPPEMPNPLLVTACAEEWQSDINYYNTSWMLGCNMNGNGNNQEMAEVIVYTNRLSDAEIARVEDYLMKKWGLKSGSVAAYDSVFAGGSSIAAEGTGVVDAQGAAVTLASLTGAGGSVTNFSSLTVTDSITLDVINGIINPLTIFGDVTFGTEDNGHDIPVYVDDWRTLDTSRSNQRAVKVLSADGEASPTVVGGLHAAEKMGNWTLLRSGSTWSVVRGGLLLIVR